jgi:hypothetical protein
MRKAINSSPLVQVGLIAALGVIVAFLLLTRMSGGEEAAPETATATAPGAATAPTTGVAPVAGAAVAPTAPATGSVPVTPAPVVTPESAAAAGKFAAGPGLPAPIVSAYARNDTVVLLITRSGAIDDEALTKLAKRLRGESGVALFHTYARDIANYSRMVQDVDRVPALVVLSPRRVTGSGAPVASVSYGFRGYESIRQAVRDAAYQGKDLPYYPE